MSARACLKLGSSILAWLHALFTRLFCAKAVEKARRNSEAVNNVFLITCKFRVFIILFNVSLFGYFGVFADDLVVVGRLGEYLAYRCYLVVAFFKIDELNTLRSASHHPYVRHFHA